MSGGELAFFAAAALSALALVISLKRDAPLWLWWSGIPHALIFDAPVVGWALAALGLASLLQTEPAKTRESARSANVLARVGFAALLAFVLLGTWARQIVTGGVTAEEAPHLGELAWLTHGLRPEPGGAGAGALLALSACLLVVGIAWAQRRAGARADLASRRAR